jgi:hypothetical protein
MNDLGEGRPIPNLFVVGAPKCGTTTLYNYLSAHSAILMSKIKEPAFFDKDSFFDSNDEARAQEWSKYLALFDRDDTEKKIRYLGDATPTMVFPKMVSRIRKMCGGDVKIIISMRNPVDRAYSHYWHGYRLGLEKGHPDSELFQEEDPASIQDTGRFPKYYVLTGRYWMHIDRFVETFGRENVLLLNFDEIIENPDGAMDKVWSFLNLSPVTVQEKRSNPSQAPRFPQIQRFLATDSSVKNVIKKFLPSALRQKVASIVTSKNVREFKYPPMSSGLRTRLENYYEQDNDILAAKYGFDVSGWSKKAGGFAEHE